MLDAECLKIVLKNIGRFMALMISVAAVTCAIGTASIYSAKLLSLSDGAVILFFAAYGSIAMGTLIGIMECKGRVS